MSIFPKRETADAFQIKSRKAGIYDISGGDRIRPCTFDVQQSTHRPSLGSHFWMIKYSNARSSVNPSVGEKAKEQRFFATGDRTESHAAVVATHIEMLVLVAPSAPIYLIEATYVSRMQTRFRIPQSLPLFWSSRLQKRSRQNKRSIVISLTTGRMEASAAHGTRNSGKQLPKPAAFPTNYPLAVSYPIAGLRTDLCNQPHRLSYSTRAFVVNRFYSLKLYAQSWPSGPVFLQTIVELTKLPVSI